MVKITSSKDEINLMNLKQSGSLVSKANETPSSGNANYKSKVPINNTLQLWRLSIIQTISVMVGYSYDRMVLLVVFMVLNVHVIITLTVPASLRKLS